MEGGSSQAGSGGWSAWVRLVVGGGMHVPGW